MSATLAGPTQAAPQAATGPPARAPPQPGIEARLGNQASLRRLQARLTIGAVDDPLEHEADAVAEQVMRAPDPASGPVDIQLSRKCETCETEEKVQTKCAACEGEEKIQAKREDDHDSSEEAPAAVDEALRQPGRPLDEPTRALFESKLDADLSGVRVHTGLAADKSAKSVGAVGYTVGEDVVFADGRYAPGSQDGRKLLAHELAHVVQQGAGQKPAVRRQDDPSGPFVVKAMDPAEAIKALKPWLPAAGDSSEAAVHAISAMLDLPPTMGNARHRVSVLTAAVSLLDAKDAAMVQGALTKPANEQQKALQAKFGRLDHRFRAPLLSIIAGKAGPAPAPADKAPADPVPASKWSELNPGVAAYLANAGETIERVAYRVSGYPPTADALAELNGVAKGVRFDTPRQIIVPAEIIDRIEVFHQMPEAMGRSMFEARQGARQVAHTEDMLRVKSGHPAGPGAFGLIPVTTAIFMHPGLIDAVHYAVGFLVGLLEGAWDAVKDLFVGAWEMIKAVASTIKNLITLQFGKIWAMLKGWAAQIKQLWNNRADIAADFMAKWEAKDPYDRGEFQGEVLGWVLVTVLITILTAGEGAIEQISGKWAGVVKLLKIAQKAGDVGTYAKAFAGAASKAATAAIDAMRASRLGKVVQVAETIAQPIIWTAKGLKAAWKLPGKIAGQLTDAAAARLKVLEPFADKIKRLTGRAKRWIFGCRSPCRWDAEFALRELEADESAIEARAAKELGEVTMDDIDVASDEVAQKVEPRARGYAIEDLHISDLEKEGYERLPDWFKTHDAIRGGTVEVERGTGLKIIRRPDAVSIKSTSITDPTRLTEKVTDDLDALRGRFEHARGGVKVVGVRSRRLDLIFEEGSRIGPDTQRALEQLKQSAGNIQFNWYVMRSGRKIPGAQYLRDLATVR